MAMQGLAVVPLFAGYDLARGTGRIFTYDVTGGHYEETEHNATGSGGRDARTTIKLGYRAGMARDDAVELAIESLYEAADEDSATGGPDLIRGIYPLVATVTADGFATVPEDEVAERFATLIERRRSGGSPAMTMPYYVAPEQVMKDRAEYAQKGIARGRSLIATAYDVGHRHRGREPVAVAPQDQRDLRPDRLRRRGQVQRVRPVAGVGHPARRHQGVRLQPRGRGRPLAGQPLRPVPRPGLHPRDEAARGGDPGGRAGRRVPTRTSCTTSPTRGPSPTRTATPSWAGRPRPSPSASRSSGTAGWSLPEALRAAVALAGRPRPDPRGCGPRGGGAGPGQRAAGLPAG